MALGIETYTRYERTGTIRFITWIANSEMSNLTSQHQWKRTQQKSNKPLQFISQ